MSKPVDEKLKHDNKKTNNMVDLKNSIVLFVAAADFLEVFLANLCSRSAKMLLKMRVKKGEKNLGGEWQLEVSSHGKLVY